MTYRLTEQAEADLADIYANGAVTFGDEAATNYIEGLFQTFTLLSRFPKIARERRELWQPARVHPYGMHLIVYRTEADGSVLVIRLRHAHEDWR